jgi:hypothetical protein
MKANSISLSYLKVTVLILSLSYTSCNGHTGKNFEEVEKQLIYQLKYTNLNDSICSLIQDHASNLFYHTLSHDLEEAISYFLTNYNATRDSTRRFSTSHAGNYCIGIRNFVEALSISRSIIDTTNFERFNKVILKYQNDIKPNRGSYVILLLYISNKLSVKEKYKIINMYYENSNNWFAIDAITSTSNNLDLQSDLLLYLIEKANILENETLCLRSIQSLKSILTFNPNYKVELKSKIQKIIDTSNVANVNLIKFNSELN